MLILLNNKFNNINIILINKNLIQQYSTLILNNLI